MKATALSDILDSAGVPKFDGPGIRIYLVDLKGDVDKCFYDVPMDNGELPRRTTTIENARATTAAMAEVVSFAGAYAGDEELNNQSYEFKRVLTGPKGPYINGPKSYGKMIYLSKFS